MKSRSQCSPRTKEKKKVDTGILVVGNFLSGVTGIRGVCEDLAGSLGENGWRIIGTSSRKNRFFRVMDMVTTTWNFHKSYSVAIVEVYSGLAFLWAKLVCSVLRIKGKPFVLILHGGNLPAFAKKWKTCVEKLLKSANIVTTPSLFIRRSLENILKDIKYIPNAIDLERYSFKLRPKPAPRLVWLRAFHRMYNPMLAVQALSSLVSEYPEIHLSMAGPDKGDGSLREVQRYADQKGIQGNLSIVGTIKKTDVPIFLENGDIFLNTTDIESFGVSVMEAAANGLCIVTTDVGELPFLWTDRENALLVPPGDPHRMAEAVRSLLTNPSLAERISHEARMKAEQFSWTAIRQKWELLLRKLTEKKQM
jgi:glycosyltransferase involved in cell wall biosynthesis